MRGRNGRVPEEREREARQTVRNDSLHSCLSNQVLGLYEGVRNHTQLNNYLLLKIWLRFSCLLIVGYLGCLSMCNNNVSNSSKIAISKR